MSDENGEKQIGKSEKFNSLMESQLESQLGTKDDNKIATKTERAKQENFSSDTLRAVTDDKSNSLQIVDGDEVLLDSHAKRKNSGGDNQNEKVFIPGAGEVDLNTDAMLNAKGDPLRKADGSFKENLVAYDASKPFQLSISTDVELYKPYVDSDGVVPFGGIVSTDGSGGKSTKYACFTLGLEGRWNGAQRDMQVLEVNIADTLMLSGSKILDGNPHRAVFPIAPSRNGGERHWKWVDATIQRVGSDVGFEIHRLSPSTEKPASDDQFDHCQTPRYKMHISNSPEHLKSAKDFWDAMHDTRLIPGQHWNGHFHYVRLDERVKD